MDYGACFKNVNPSNSQSLGFKHHQGVRCKKKAKIDLFFEYFQWNHKHTFLYFIKNKMINAVRSDWCVDSCKILVKCDLFHFSLLLSKTHCLWHKHSYCYPALRVFGNEVVVARGPCDKRCLSKVHLLLKAARPRTEPQLFGWRNVYWLVLERTTVDLTTRRCSRASDRIYCAQHGPKLSFTQPCQLPSCIPCLFLSTSICNRFLWFIQ